jgi:hypothetical protein
VDGAGNSKIDRNRHERPVADSLYSEKQASAPSFAALWCSHWRVMRYRFGELVFSLDERKAAANLRKHPRASRKPARCSSIHSAAYDDPVRSEHEQKEFFRSYTLRKTIQSASSVLVDPPPA